MQEYDIVLADAGDALFIIIFIIVMIIRQFAKITKPQTPSDDDESDVTFRNEEKGVSDAQAELEAFLQNLTGAPKPAAPPKPATPPKPRPEKRVVQHAPQAVTVPPVRRQVRQRPNPQPVVQKTPARTPQPQKPKSYTTDQKPAPVTKNAYTLKKSSRIAGRSSLHKIRMEIGSDLINMTGMRKAVVLNEILGPPIALKNKQAGV